MKQTEKNWLIIALIGIGFVFVWTFSNYRNAKQKETEIKNQQIEKEIKKNEKENETNILPSITSTELKKEISQQNPPLIVDIRDVNLYQKSHIINSLHLNELNANQTNDNIILVSTNGNETHLISIYKSLAQENNQVKILSGGFDQWKNSGGIVISIGDPNSFVDQSKVNFAEPRDVNKIYTENPESILIIDVRREGNFANGHVPGAINISYSELEKKYRDISTRKDIYVYGADEITSFSAGVILYDLGFFNTKTIKDGFSAWEKYEYPIETETNSSENI